MRKTPLAIICASLLSPTSNLYAQEAWVDETVVVTANRFEQNMDSVLVPVEVVTKEEIQAIQANSLEEILRRLPGVHVTTSGGYGQQASLFVRGSESDHTLILINGVRLNSATNGGATLGTLPLTGIERIEYVRGPRTAIYGSDAIGGVINIITSFTGEETDLWLETGSDNYQKYAASSAKKVGESSWFKLALSRESTDGFNVSTEDSYSFDPDDDSYEHNDVIFELGHEASQNVTLKFNGGYSEGTTEFDIGITDQTLMNGSFIASYQSDKLTSEMILAYLHNEADTDNGKSIHSTKRSSVAWQNNYQLNSDFQLLAGIDWLKDDVSETTAQFSETTRTNLGIYGSVIYIRDKLQAESSIRFDDNQRYGSNTTWLLGAGYQLTPLYRFSVMSGTAFKAPTFNDLYDDSWGNANPNLKPEESKNHEVALDITHPFIDFRIAAYRNEITNLITYVGSGLPYENVNQTDINGLELSTKFNTGLLHHTASFDIIDAKDQDDEKLDRRPKYSGKWNMSYLADDWGANISYLYRGKTQDFAGDIDAHSLVDAAVHYYLTDEFIVRARIANLFDKEYVTASGYNSQQRSYYLALNYQF